MSVECLLLSLCAKPHARSSGVGFGRRVFTDLLTLAAKHGSTDLSIQVGPRGALSL